MKLEKVDPLAISNWNEYVLDTQFPSIFHTQNWLRVLHESYGYQPYYLGRLENDRLVVSIPIMEVKSWITGTRGISLPFSDYCDPIISEKDNFSSCFGQMVDIGTERNWRYIEMRCEEDLMGSVSSWNWYYRHVLSLDKDESVIFKKIRANYRAKIRKAIKNNVRTEIFQTPDAMEEYFRLHCLTRKRLGLPPQPEIFFKNIYKEIISKNLGFVALALQDEKCLSGAIFFHFGKQAVYKFGAMDMKYQKLNPNYLLFWDLIKWLCNNGYRELCFGKTSSDNKGLIQFKDGWGTKQFKIKYYRYDLKKHSFVQNSNKSIETGYTLFRKMPVSLLKVAGKLLYPHVG